MANEMNLLNWTFFREVDIPDDITTLLVENEKPVASFATIRDVAVFTNKRLIVKDAQGITGRNLLSSLLINLNVVNRKCRKTI